ncbi:hypothetical protein ACFQFC_17050 [Amorphoplanes digitatis]|uniref:Uncharacterized protein n=1 Tax=Actinoplanes digitatis TaxID=1868 RepID=A0A7W7MTM5_9ACTN|nr:hypothetical protein [Actinoplanes digitatis]MBB4765922.1 hypothetical protein [Actinoplanes digitatis]BFE75876.1 hypothetical protein GCM10020092_091770 [Actinoplanes digitatis]GID93284.1 hypothetical protein Adi01nite_26960 [Actinoplanes digitatis]
MSRSRRAGMSRDEARQQPLYARMLGLQYLAPSGFLCFVFLEGAVALGILLALAELVSWWGVLVLPTTVAVMVKLNDVVAGMVIRSGAARPVAVNRRAARGYEPGEDTVRLPTSVIAPSRSSGASAFRSADVRQTTAPGGPIGERWAAPPVGAIDASAMNGPPVGWPRAELLDERQQRARQSAARRYQ